MNIDEKELNYLIDYYSREKKELDKTKKTTDELNSKLKELLEKYGLDEFDGYDYTISRSIINTDKLDEDRLIVMLHKILPEEMQKQVIHTKEFLDLDKLEDLVYNRAIDADVVNNCIIHKKPTIRLNIRKNKKGEDEDA